MSNKVFETYKELPSWAKGIVVVGGLIVVYIAGSAIYRKVFPPKTSQSIQNVEDDITKFQSQQKATYPDSAYDAYANSIWASVGAFSYDSATVKDVLMQMMNNLDVAKLIKAYGIRYDYKVPFYGNAGDPYDVLSVSRHIINGDLFGLYKSRADDVNNDWKSKGITYQI